MTLDCEPSPLFRPQEYALPDSLVPLVRMVTGRETIIIIPFMLHSLSMSVFSSVIGPFGGFFASGFKRAFKIKVRFSKSICHFIKILITDFYLLGFWRHHSRPRWNYGPFRLPIPNGHICQRLHFLIYPQ